MSKNINDKWRLYRCSATISPEVRGMWQSADILKLLDEISALEAQVERLSAPVTRYEWDHAYPTAKLAWNVMTQILEARKGGSK